jgi:hypothetical protein
MRLARPALAGLAFALLATGCDNKSAPETNDVVVPVPEEPASNMADAPPPVVVNEAVANAVIGLSEEERLSQEQQMQEDADATGMTSRLPPAEEQPANVAQ